MRVTKSHLVKTVSNRTGLSQSLSAQAIEAIIASMVRSLASGDMVKISGFGRFDVRTRNGRNGHNPRTGRPIRIPPRRDIGFKAFQHLKQQVDYSRSQDAQGAPSRERRRERQRQELEQGRAVVRISGIPVCEFAVKDISGNGTCFMMDRNSQVLRNLRVGKEIEIHMQFSEDGRHATMQRSRIAHITYPEKGAPYHGFVLVGLQIIDRL